LSLLRVSESRDRFEGLRSDASSCIDRGVRSVRTEATREGGSESNTSWSDAVEREMERVAVERAKICR
jgi:hypothetical protein